MRTLLLSLLFAFLIALPASSQEVEMDTVVRREGGGWRRTLLLADSLLNRRYWRALQSFDTTYITKPHTRLTLRGRLNSSGAAMHARGTYDEQEFTYNLDADMRQTLSLGVNYRGLGFAITLNPLRLVGKNKDLEFNLNSYGNRFGADLIFSSANTYHGTASYAGDELQIDAGAVEQQLWTSNIYYVFNHRRFSYPAAFSQSQLQRRTASTLMMGVCGFAGVIRAHQSILTNQSNIKLSFRQLGIGIGAGHNHVTRSGKWLFHLSVIPHIVVVNHVRIYADDARQKSPFRFPNLLNVGRLAVVHNRGNTFYGISAVVNNNLAGDRKKLLMTDIKWRARIFYGKRL